MDPRRYRVIAWSTGQVGIEAIRGIVRHPRLELVGVWVHSPPKEGRDVGELAGLEPVGVAASRDVDALLSLGADCVCYTATDNDRADEVIDEWCRILAAGLNVVASTFTTLVYPPSNPEVTARLEDACRAGSSSLHVAGIHPGFVLDALPVFLSSLSSGIRRIGLSESFDASAYNDPLVMAAIGFGVSPEAFEARRAVNELLFDRLWGATHRLLAETLNLELDEHRVFAEWVVASKAFDIPALRVGEGAITAVRLGYEGSRRGEVRLTLDEYVVVRPPRDQEFWPSEWPDPPGPDGGYRIRIEGDPVLQFDLSFRGEDDKPVVLQAVTSTAQRIVNSIPAVCEAQPGVHTFRTLAQIQGWVS